MICAHCKGRDVNVAHVKTCSVQERLVREVGATVIGAPAVEKPRSLFSQPVEGIYLACDPSVTGAPVSYYKVVQSPSTGRWYAKRWDGGSWVYEGKSPLLFITQADRITGEQAARFGHTTGQCVFCSRGLTDERSIHVGYGPTCAKRHNLPWGEVAEVTA